ncbi:MAG: hypothetical protein R3F62_15810 [Planctomycetota bacterium]
MAQALARKAREWGGLLAAAGGAAAAATPIYDRDWGWHLATYRRMRDELALPTEDLFSYASQGAYEPVHWVFQLVLGGLVDLCGLAGLSVYRLGLSALFAWALYAVLRRAGARTGAALLALSWVLVGAWRRLLVRPHLVSFLGVVLALGVLLDWRRRRRGAWRLVPLFLVWANAHPGILFGVLLVLGFAAAETAQAAWRREPLGEHARLWGWVLAACAATGLNPLGFGLFPYLVAHRDMQAAIDVSELRGLFERPERGVVWHLLLTWLYGAGVAVYALRVRGWASWVLLGACAVGVGAALWQVPDAQVALVPLLALLLGALGVSLARGPRGRCDLTLVGAVGAFGILGVVVAREGAPWPWRCSRCSSPPPPRPRGRALHAAGARGTRGRPGPGRADLRPGLGARALRAIPGGLHGLDPRRAPRGSATAPAGSAATSCTGCGRATGCSPTGACPCSSRRCP